MTHDWAQDRFAETCIRIPIQNKFIGSIHNGLCTWSGKEGSGDSVENSHPTEQEQRTERSLIRRIRLELVDQFFLPHLMGGSN